MHPINAEDVRSARLLADSYPQLGARDLLHLAVCRRHAVDRIKTFDRALAAAFGGS
jgi:predicted nucleic acid-binding protein